MATCFDSPWLIIKPTKMYRTRLVVQSEIVILLIETTFLQKFCYTILDIVLNAANCSRNDTNIALTVFIWFWNTFKIKLINYPYFKCVSELRRIKLLCTKRIEIQLCTNIKQKLQLNSKS